MGEVQHIYIYPETGARGIEKTQVLVEPGKGIEGDRYRFMEDYKFIERLLHILS